MTTLCIDEVRFERMTGTIGATVHGVALRGPRAPGTAETLRRALHEHGVLFFDFGEIVGTQDFSAFAELFGEVEEAYRFSSNTSEDVYIDSDRMPMKSARINHWHTDGTPFENPPQAALLTAIEVPEAGGDTMWASMSAAWDALSPHYQRLLEGAEVLHSTARLPWLKSTASCVHPAMIRDAVTGRKLLFVNSNYSERVVGMSARESDALLQMLFDHVNTPEFHVRLRWRPGMVAVWEERVTQHRGVADFTGPRKLRRLTLVGDRPAA